MTDDKKNEYKPHVDIHNFITLAQFFDYLKEKDVSNKCPACNKMTMSGVVSVESGQSLALNVINKEMDRFLAYECVGRICLSCGNVQLFWTNMVRSWVESKLKENKEG